MESGDLLASKCWLSASRLAAVGEQLAGQTQLRVIERGQEEVGDQAVGGRRGGIDLFVFGEPAEDLGESLGAHRVNQDALNARVE